jgi:hypothetical protein
VARQAESVEDSSEASRKSRHKFHQGFALRPTSTLHALAGLFSMWTLGEWDRAGRESGEGVLAVAVEAEKDSIMKTLRRRHCS